MKTWIVSLLAWVPVLGAVADSVDTQTRMASSESLFVSQSSSPEPALVAGARASQGKSTSD